MAMPVVFVAPLGCGLSKPTNSSSFYSSCRSLPFPAKLPSLSPRSRGLAAEESAFRRRISRSLHTRVLGVSFAASVVSLWVFSYLSHKKQTPPHLRDGVNFIHNSIVCLRCLGLSGRFSHLFRPCFRPLLHLLHGHIFNVLRQAPGMSERILQLSVAVSPELVLQRHHHLASCLRRTVKRRIYFVRIHKERETRRIVWI